MKAWKPPTRDWDKRSQNAIAQNALTNSKRPSTFVEGIYPTHLTRGEGCHVWDVEGNKYVDFICGLGSNILGYANSDVTEAVITQARLGSTLSLSTNLEVCFAEKVQEIFPFVERMKILKTGSDACSASIRIARAATGRKRIVTEGYHGFHDEFVSILPPALGVGGLFPLESITPEISALDLAAIIVEPVMTDASYERIARLKYLRSFCDRTGALLIFDEVITGFRFQGLSVSNHYQIKPDLICLGKAMGNGMPVSIVGGPKAIMECGEYFVSSTFAGETLSLASGLKTMSLLQTKYNIDQLWSEGRRFLEKFNSIWPEKLKIDGYPTRGVFTGDPMTKALFWQEASKAGILFGPSWFINFAHIGHLEAVLSACEAIFQRLKTGAVELQGKMPMSPFAQQVREQNESNRQ